MKKPDQPDNARRLRGQEIAIAVIADGAQQDAFSSITNFDDEAKFTKSQNGFIGETSDRYDFIYNGTDGKFTMHLSNQKWLSFKALMKQKATRENVNIVFNIVRTDFYANGDTPTISYYDVSFGPMPSNISSRGDFVTVSLDFSCSDTDDNLQAVI